MFENSAFVLATFCVLVLLGLNQWLSPNCVDAEDCPAVLVENETVLSKGRRGINFAAVEKALSQLSFDSGQALIFNPATESALSTASASLEENLSDSDIQQLRALVIKSFPARKGRELTSILLRFHGYYLARQELEQRKLVEESNDNASALAVLEQALMDQEERELLQRQHLGEVLADRLYQQQNQLARALLRMQMIAADESLNEDEKQKQTAVVEKEIERAMRQAN